MIINFNGRSWQMMMMRMLIIDCDINGDLIIIMNRRSAPRFWPRCRGSKQRLHAWWEPFT